MHWLTVTWSMAASACLTLALMHLVIWVKHRANLDHLLLSIAAIAIAGVAAGELAMMLAQTPQQFGVALRWTHFPLAIVMISLVGFVRVYLKSGRAWLGWTVCALRVLVLIVNFSVWPNLNYRAITGLEHVSMLGGESAAVAVGVPSPWMRLGQISSFLFLVFVADASIGRWRRGSRRERRKAARVGGSLTFAVVAAFVQAMLVLEGIIHWPYLISIPFLVPLCVMGYELGSDVVRAARLSRELQASRDELHTVEQRMSLAANAAELGLWEWDLEADRVWMTQRARDMFGINGEPAVTLDAFLARLHPDDRGQACALMKSAAQNGHEYEAEYRVESSNGEVRWLAARGNVQANGSRNARLLRGVSIDITRRKQAEERFRLAVEASPNAMIVVGPDGNIALVNAQAESTLGYARSEMIGKSFDLFVPDPGQRAGTARREIFGRRKDGTELPLEVGFSPIQTTDGTLLLASIVDLTERRQAEREAARQRNELAHLSRVTMLGELSGSLAHELNQPLTAILSNAQAALRFLAQDQTDPQEVREILSDIIDADKRAGETIRRLRLLFRKGEVENQPMDVNALVQEVLKILNSDLINNMVFAQTQLEPDLPPVRGDRVQMQQVLINLIVNGCDAMAATVAGDRKLMVSTRSDPQASVCITIADRGSGIPAEKLEHIFEPFVTTKGYGMGLGLAVCKTIVAAHGGKIWATNNSDRGASVHITLPVIEVGA